MATRGPTNVPAFLSTDADFQALVQAVHAALAALGFIQTTDTGQINPATVAKPTAVNTMAGSEFWRFNDTLQATVPLFFRVEYGVGVNVSIPQIAITMGSSTNGTGSLAGQIGTRMLTYANTGKTAGTQLPFYMSSSSDGADLSFAFYVDTASTNYGSLIHISRPRDQNGNATADGVYTLWLQQNNSFQDQFIPPSGAIPAYVTNSFPGVSPTRFSRSSSGGNADVCSTLLPINGNWRYTKVLITGSADFGVGGSFTCQLFGANHTFLALGKSVGDVQPVALGSGTNPGWAMSWE